MNKATRLFCVLCAAALLTACAPQKQEIPSEASTAPKPAVSLPEAKAPESLATDQEVLLYYRFSDEPYLAAEKRTLTLSPSEAYEMALVTALLAGPAGRTGDLTTLFPEGTRVLATSRQGRTLFVTLSREIMNAYADEGAALTPATASYESRLRRTLCMQSLVATVTENCDVDGVQVLVEQASSAAESLRLKEKYFLTTADETRLTVPQTRREELLLTPANTLRVVLEKWVLRDWSKLYLYLASTDPATGEGRKNLADFITAMENLPCLTGFTFEGGSLSPDGMNITYTITATLLAQDGQTINCEGKVLRLCRESERWTVPLTQLTGWLEGVNV